jgi:CRP-like cAMP-binding protein
MSAEVDEILTQLRQAGERRRAASRYTSDGLRTREAALADIRAYGAEARRLKVTHKQLADTLGVGDSTWYAILSGTRKS